MRLLRNALGAAAVVALAIPAGDRLITAFRLVARREIARALRVVGAGEIDADGRVFVAPVVVFLGAEVVSLRARLADTKRAAARAAVRRARGAAVDRNRRAAVF